MSPSEIALTYLGQTEKPKNSGFSDAAFEKKMHEVGFVTGHAWCSYFCELVFKEAYPEKFEELNKMFSGSTIQTFRNFRDAAYPTGNIPRVNHLAIWQMYKEGKAQPTGHAGIVVSVLDTWQFDSVEGNTSGAGSREGWIVARQHRKVLASVANGLKILGFVQINGEINLKI